MCHSGPNLANEKGITYWERNKGELHSEQQSNHKVTKCLRIIMINAEYVWKTINFSKLHEI